jgi:hypothetical protein
MFAGLEGAPVSAEQQAGRGGWAAQPVWMFGGREKSLACVGMDAPFLGRVDMQYSTTLST